MAKSSCQSADWHEVQQVGTADVHIQLVDSAGAATLQEFTITISGVNLPPQITSNPPPTSAAEGQLYTYGVTATDPDGDPLHFTLLTYPAGMTIDPSSGLMTWTAMAARPGPYPVTVQVDDGLLSTTQSFAIHVSATVYLAPQITLKPALYAATGLLYQYQVVATDPNGLPQTYSLLNPLGRQ